jgi:hypothetical protein
MNAIIGNRGSGKTTALIKLSSKHQLYILVLNRERQKQLFQQAHDLGYQIPYPITLDDFLADKLRGSHIREILIDDVDDILKHIFATVKINTVSLTNPDFIYMLTVDPSESEADLDIDEEIKKFENNAEFERTHENLRGCQYFKKLAALLRELKTLKAEQCEDAISREEMLKYQYYLHGKMSNEENHKLWQFIKSLPSVTPKQKTGKWNVLGYDDPSVRMYKCSECHMKITLKFNYCPNCGAKMEGGKK